jgi:hypothetical protein
VASENWPIPCHDLRLLAFKLEENQALLLKQPTVALSPSSPQEINTDFGIRNTLMM